MGDETKTDILNGLGDGTKEDNFSGDFAGGRDHGDWIDNRDGVEKSLNKDVPDGSDIAVFDIDRAKQEGETEGEEINFEDGWDSKEPSRTWGDAVNEGENNNDDNVD